MTKFLKGSLESWGISLKDPGRSAKVARLSHCGDYLVVIDDICQVLEFCLSTGEGWRVPVQGRACSIILNNANEFAVLADNGTVQRFDLTLPTICLGTLSLASISSICYDHTGTMLVVAQTNGRVRIYDLEIRPVPALIAMFKVSDGAIPLLGARQDCVLGVERGGRVFCLRSPECEPQILWNGAAHLDLDCYTMAVHPFLPRLVVAGFGGYVRYYSAYNARPTSLLTSFNYVHDLIFLYDVNQLAVIGDTGLEVWNIETFALEWSWQPKTGRAVAARPIGNRLRALWC